ncbi:MAG TPA: aspartate--tRNA(Asn) ligase [Candidatus Bariatricus faecipullorum]|nr:aspartate--tRNA(Asn) ligase [Candidatus Bariatricus faecipullorum]
MEFLTGVKEEQTLSLAQLKEPERLGQTVQVQGAVHALRDMGNVAFVVLRRRDGLVQCVYEEGVTKFNLKDIREAATVEVTGKLEASEKAPGGVEIRLLDVRVLSMPEAPLPLAISKWKLNTSLEARLNYRSISLRNIRERAKFKVQEGLVRGFREFLYQQGFTEIHTPKIGAKGAEGGSNLFRLDYFHRPAVLEQSPQLYKQMMVGVFDRVFETGPVFRAEKHNTKRHLNEYTSLDFEMGYIEGFEDVMAMETGFLQYAIELLKKDYAKELSILDVSLPEVSRIPAIRFDEAKEKVAEKYQRKIRNPFDLEPEEEQLIGRYAKEEWGADFVFVTHYPSKKRPFYAMDDPEDERYTLSFDLLFRGLEVTTGGQRIHDYQMLLEKLEKRGMTEEGLETYLDTFKHGMPPHGGLGIGMERLTMQLLGEENVRETTLFPRDLSRLVP